MLNEPRDFLGAMIARMLTNVIEEEKGLGAINEWNMTVMIQTDFYDISMNFNNGVFISTDPIENPTLRASTTFESLLRILGGRTSLLSAFLGGAVKVDGFLRHPIAAARFYRLMNKMLS